MRSNEKKKTALTEQSLAATPLVNRTKIELSVAAMTWAFILAQTNRNSSGQIYKFITNLPRYKFFIGTNLFFVHPIRSTSDWALKESYTVGSLPE